MINGLYLSAQGAQSQQVRLGVISNNLANSSTTGFKRDLALFQSHAPFDATRGNSGDLPENLKSSLGGVTTAEIRTDFSQNAVRPTGGSLDLALTGPGFIKVEQGGETFLTRDGRLQVSEDGTLVTSGNQQVLSDAGTPLSVDPVGGAIVISPLGAVSQESPQGLLGIGNIALVEPNSYEALSKAGKNLYRNAGGDKPAGKDLSVKQGYVEWSGVEPVQEMVQLIETSRAFEANMNMIKYQDEALGTLLSTVPRL